MTEFSAVRTFRASMRATMERGAALVVLFFLLGVTGFLAWNAAAAYAFEFQVVVAVFTALFCAGAAVISLNMLIDSSTKIKLSSLYVMDYKGIVWTTTTLILGWAVLELLFITSSALFWIPVVNEEPYLTTLLAGGTLSLPAWYALIVQVQSLLLMLYLKSRFMLFPVFVAVENKSAVAAMKTSWDTTRGHVVKLALLLVVATGVMTGFTVIGMRTAPVVTAAVAGLHPYAVQVAVSGTATFFSAIGVVFLLAVLATTYSAFK